MKNCEYYEELISRSLDDELSVEERKELAVHLAGCPKCSELWQLMADISGMMKTDMEQLPEGLHENIMADIRRSEMIKNNVAANANTGIKAKATIEKKISKPVRNMLATAACLAVVVAAAIAVNPSDRAEDVVLERSSASTTAVSSDESAEAVPEVETETNETAVTPTAEPTSTAAPSTTQAAVSTPKPSTSGSNVIITTPAPTADTYLSTPKPTTRPTTSSGATTIISTPTPAPTSTPVPTAAPTATATATPVPTASSTAEQKQDMDADSAVSAASDDKTDDSGEYTEEIITDVAEKVSPARIFSMFPSLAGISLEPEVEETQDEVQEGAEAAETAETAATEEADSDEQDMPEPVQLDLMNKEKTDELIKLLVGVVDNEQETQSTDAATEEELAPEQAQLPEGQWDDSFIIKLIYNNIPCELTVQTYEGNVYFSIAELVIEPPAEDATGEGKSIEAPIPAPTPTPSDEAAEDVSASPEPTVEPDQSEEESTEEQENEYYPVWLLSKCSNKDFTSLITSIMKELAKH